MTRLLADLSGFISVVGHPVTRTDNGLTPADPAGGPRHLELKRGLRQKLGAKKGHGRAWAVGQKLGRSRAARMRGAAGCNG